MKKLSAVIMLLLCFSPFACNRPLSPYAPAPLPTATFTVTPVPNTPTPSPTGTPVCGFTPVAISMPSNYGTPGPGTPTLTPYPTPPFGPVSPSGTVTPVYTFTPPPVIAAVIRSQSDWQTFYGTTTAPPAPVDFTTTMLIVYKRSYCPCNNIGVVKVCTDSSYVTVTFGDIGPYCWATCPQPALWGLAGVAIPQTSLPVTWAPPYP